MTLARSADSESISPAAKDLQNSTITSNTLISLRRIVESGHSPELIALAISAEAQTEEQHCAMMEKIMASLEAVAETDLSLACLLMCDLLKPASDAFMHHVWDAIGLWLRACDSEELKTRLTLLASVGPVVEMRRYFREIVEQKWG